MYATCSEVTFTLINYFPLFLKVFSDPEAWFQVVPKVLQRDIPRCETFRNLKHLHLGEWFLINGCNPLISLLRRYPT
jgi:hypothetical protein